MIFVQGWIRVSEHDLEDIVPAASVMMVETIKEPGCLHYSFAKDVSDSGLIHISERWDSEDSLNTHFQTQHMSHFNAALSGFTIEAMDVRMYSGEEVKIMIQS